MTDQKKNIKHFKMERLSLSADAKDGRAKLTWSIRDGYPRATVALFDYNKPELKKLVPCNMDMQEMMVFLTAGIKAIEESGKISMDSFSRRYEESTGRKSGDKYLASTITVDGTGDVVKIIVEDKDLGGSYEFVFEPSEYHKLYIQGKEATLQQHSRALAHGYLSTVKDIFEQLYVEASVLVNGELPTKPAVKQEESDNKDEFF